MKWSFALRLAAVLMAGTMAVSGCSSKAPRDPADRPVNPFKPKDDKRDLLVKKPAVTDEGLKQEAQQLYRTARKSLDAGDYTEAMTRYNAVTERYPFTEYATQAELDKIYVLHHDYKSDEALSAADRFLRDHPRNPHADYVQYLKGVIQTERDAGLLQSLGVDTTKQDVSNLRKAYDEFSLLIQKYPNSRYNVDARARMIDLRNRIAENEMSAVRFYIKRGANLAAARRAEQIIVQYPGAPATLEALKVLSGNLRALNLQDDASRADQLLAQQSRKRYIETSIPANVVTAPAATASAPVPPPPSDIAPAAPAEPAKKPGLLSRFVGLFSFLDPDKNPGPEYVIQTGNAPAPATTAPAATAATGTAATGSTTAASGGDAKTNAAAPAPQKRKFIIGIDADDSPSAPQPAVSDAPATKAGSSTSVPADVPAKP
jgi:outer membrane assembly lipoprotein YfiO